MSKSVVHADGSPWTSMVGEVSEVSDFYTPLKLSLRGVRDREKE
jgi:hypothetical protein